MKHPYHSIEATYPKNDPHSGRDCVNPPSEWDQAGRPVRNLQAIRAIAIKQAKESSDTHSRFRCPGCSTSFLASYGRFARQQWPDEYEITCIDCIREWNLEVDRRHK